MSESFIRRHRKDWDRFNNILVKMERTGSRLLSEEETRQFGPLYRKVSTDLAYAQAQGFDYELVEYLNDLAGRGYHQLYTPVSAGRSFIRFFGEELPSSIRKHQKSFWLSIALILIGILAGYLFALYLPDHAEHFFPSKIGQDLLERHKEDKWFNHPLSQRPLVSSMLFYNNIRVAIGSFALGIFGGVFSLFVLLYNSMLLGRLAEFFTREGFAYAFWSSILPHGIIELTALGLAAAAGWIIGLTLLFPGELRRADALRIKAREASHLFVTSAILLVIAGLIEGLFSTIPTSVIPNEGRLAFAGLTLVFLFFLGRKTGITLYEKETRFD